MIVVLLCCAPLVAQVRSERSFGESPALANEEIRVVTWNIYDGDGDLEGEFWANSHFRSAHVICLQEAPKKVVRDFSRRHGWYYALHGGDAILSRCPIIDSGRVSVNPRTQRKAVWADVWLDQDLITRVYSCHLSFKTWLLPFVAATRRAEMKRMVKHAEKFISQRKATLALQGLPVPKRIPVIIAGDFNTIGWFLGGWESEACIRYLNRKGWTNAFRDASAKTHALGRLDWVFTLGFKREKSKTGNYAGSDHRWMMARLRLVPGALAP